MPIKINLMFNLVFTNPITMSFTFNDFEFRYPENSLLAKERVVKYLTVYTSYVISQLCPLYCVLYSVHITWSYGIRVCTGKTLKDRHIHTKANPLTTVHPTRNSPC